MKKGQIYEGYVERMDFPNKGIVRVESEEGIEYAVVKDALPGRRISFVVTKRRGGKYEGRSKSVMATAECEKMAGNGAVHCPHAGICGGCLYQNFPYEETIRIKEMQVKKLLEAYIGEAFYDGLIPSPQEEDYRNKMEYTFGDEYRDGPLALGLHKRGSFYDILTVADCRIAPDDFGKILSYTLDFFREHGIPYYHRMKHNGILRHLLLRRSHADGSLMIGLVTTSELAEDLAEDWCGGLLHLSLAGKPASVLHIINDSFADAVKCDRLQKLYGGDFLTEDLLGMKFRISPFSFFQTNSAGAERLYSLVRDYLLWGTKKTDADSEDPGGSVSYREREDGAGQKGTVFDLYSGTGTIAQIISPAAEKVIAVEIVEEAVEAARENAKLNGIENCIFLADDVLKALDEIEERPDHIILDPPRDGIHPKALKKILDYGVESLVYISCKPTSLARDMEAITRAGYHIRRWGMVDMFPFTGNIETVCLLGRRKPDDTIKVSVNMDDYYQIRDAEEAEKNPS